MIISQERGQNNKFAAENEKKDDTFSNYFLSFLNPNKLFLFESSLFYWSVAPGKIGKKNFQVGKKIVLIGKIFFLVGKIIFPIFPHEKIRKVKKIFCYHNCPDLSLFE
jgi:hypothetical protein